MDQILRVYFTLFTRVWLAFACCGRFVNGGTFQQQHGRKRPLFVFYLALNAIPMYVQDDLVGTIAVLCLIFSLDPYGFTLNPPCCAFNACTEIRLLLDRFGLDPS